MSKTAQLTSRQTDSSTPHYRGLLSISQAAHYLGLSVYTLRRWESEGKLQSIRTEGGVRRYRLSDLQKLFRADKIPEVKTGAANDILNHQLDSTIKSKLDYYDLVIKAAKEQLDTIQLSQTTNKYNKGRNILVSLSLFLLVFTLIPTSTLVLGYLTKPDSTKHFLATGSFDVPQPTSSDEVGSAVLAESTTMKANILTDVISGFLGIFDSIAQKSIEVVSPKKAEELELPTTPDNTVIINQLSQKIDDLSISLDEVIKTQSDQEDSIATLRSDSSLVPSSSTLSNITSISPGTTYTDLLGKTILDSSGNIYPSSGVSATLGTKNNKYNGLYLNGFGVDSEGNATLKAITVTSCTGCPLPTSQFDSTIYIKGSTSGNKLTLKAHDDTTSHTLTFPSALGTSGYILSTDTTGVLSWIAPGASLSGITAATATNTLSNGDFAQVWNFGLTTADKVAFTFGESTASTASGTSAILSASTLASSTATPLHVKNLGTGHSLRVDDVASDTTPFVVTNTGDVGIGTTTPSEKLHVVGNVKVEGATLNNNISWQDKSPPDITFNGIYFADANTGWVVGNNGFINKSTDGGTTWTKLASNTINVLRGIKCTSTSVCYVVGDAGTILKTTNGGTSWSSQTSGVTTNLLAIHCTDASTCWAVGASGTIVKTTNGSTWSSLTSGVTIQLNGVYFASSSIGWTVGASGSLRKTTDGGTNWTAQTSGTTQNLSGIYCTDTSICLAVGASGVMLKTWDGGTNWITITPPTGVTLNAVYFVDANNGWAVGTGGTIFKTTNGGNNWFWGGSPSGPTLNAIFATSSSVAWVTGTNGIITKTTNGVSWFNLTTTASNSTRGLYAPSSTTAYGVGTEMVFRKTSDSGSSWGGSDQGPPMINNTNAGNASNATGYFINSTTGWVVGSSQGGIVKTTDSGSSWTLQTPEVVGNNLSSLSFYDSSNGFGVGANGQVICTTNGGGTWTFGSPGFTTTMNAVHAFSSARQWIVGNGGAIRSSTSTCSDSQSWSSQTSGVATDLKGVYGASATVAWAVGASDVIRKTTDGGSNWSGQTSGTTGITYNSVYASSTTVAWAVGSGGTIRKTTDGGTNWSAQTSNTANDLNSIWCADANTCWAVGASGTIVATTDGGTNWAAQTSGTANALRAVRSSSTTVAWAVGSGGTILKTTDGGTNWSAQTSGITGNSLHYISCADANTCWAVGGGGSLIKTTDGGSAWSTQTHHTGSQSLYFVKAIDSNTVYAIGIGLVLKTTNGGTSWSNPTVGQRFNMLGVSFIDANTGWSVGQSGIIVKTTDAGVTWTQQGSATSNQLNAVKFVSSTVGWAVGASGTIVKTTNGGTSWTALSSPTGNNLLGIYAADANTLWVVGQSGTIIKSTDGGTTWTFQTFTTTQNFNAVQFIDSNTGWIAGNNSILLKTTDGGSNWTQYPFVLLGNPSTNTVAMSFADSNNGWITASSQAGVPIFKTNSGGTIWGQEFAVRPLGSFGGIHAISAVSSTTAWAAGDSGAIMFNNGTTFTQQLGEAADVAELYSSKDNLEAGEIVSASGGTNVGRASLEEGEVLGVVSTNPALVIEGSSLHLVGGLYNNTTGKYPIALAGRVPVKVSNESGVVKKGNYLTLSSIPGVAMKATKPGVTIGQALEDFDPEKEETQSTLCGPNIKCGKVLTFVQSTFADPYNILTNISKDSEGNLVIEKLKVKTLTVDSNESTLSGQLNLTPPDILMATGSATLASLKTSEASVSGMLTAYNLSVSNIFKALGEAILGKTTIAGNLTVDGTFSVDNGSEINVLPTLFLQKSLLSTKVDLFDGIIIMDREGKVLTPQIVINKLTILDSPVATSSATLARSIGSGTILVGKTFVIVPTSAINKDSRVFITPTSPTDRTLAVSNIKEGLSFDVVILQPALDDINFNWWIVDNPEKLTTN